MYGNLSDGQKDALKRGQEDLNRPLDSKARFEADKDVAARIKEVSGNAPAAVYYGRYHTSRDAGDIDANLGEKNTATINLYRDRDAERAGEGAMIKPDASDKPNHTLYIKEGEMKQADGSTVRLKQDDAVNKGQTEAPVVRPQTAPAYPSLGGNG